MNLELKIFEKKFKVFIIILYLFLINVIMFEYYKE